jgi:hypothetical protein
MHRPRHRDAGGEVIVFALISGYLGAALVLIGCSDGCEPWTIITGFVLLTTGMLVGGFESLKRPPCQCSFCRTRRGDP